jgi:type I restriction-modification system DNA methylase subunit
MFGTLTYSRDTWEIFCDFLELTATCISNAVDIIHFDEREKKYLATIKKYTPEHQKLFSEMFAKLILALEYEWQTGGFTDVLGCLFHELELHNKFRGQFFTPQIICNMMGKISLGENDKTIQEKGFIKVSEPACGSGAMVLGFANAMRDCNYNHSQQMLVSAVDIDLKCVYMCYLQLSLYGIPAEVTHGNSLTLEEWSHWVTPVYVFGGWRWKRKSVTENNQELVDEAPAKVVMPTKQEAVKAFEQLDLFNFFGEGGE